MFGRGHEDDLLIFINQPEKTMRSNPVTPYWIRNVAVDAF
jgi:hypothetical protein